MKLTKHHGLGNDFLVLLDEANGPLPAVDGDLARRLCDRHRGVGADGLIRAGDGEGRADVSMLLYNSDGSRAEMSGNGVRCLAQAVACSRGVDVLEITVATDAGLRTISVGPGPSPSVHVIRAEMGPAGDGPAVPPLVEDRLGEARHRTVDLGNPHLVVWVDDLTRARPADDGSWIDDQFAHGINVEYITRADGPRAVDMLVWERGAGVTEACGTGACAAAVAAAGWGMVSSPVEVRMPGGQAIVELAGEGPALLGPIHFIATVEVADG
jgi:diaminopimelate epimerase